MLSFKLFYATNDVLIILDGDLTVPPEDIPKVLEKN